MDEFLQITFGGTEMLNRGLIPRVVLDKFRRFFVGELKKGSTAGAALIGWENLRQERLRIQAQLMELSSTFQDKYFSICLGNEVGDIQPLEMAIDVRFSGGDVCVKIINNCQSFCSRDSQLGDLAHTRFEYTCPTRFRVLDASFPKSVLDTLCSYGIIPSNVKLVRLSVMQQECYQQRLESTFKPLCSGKYLKVQAGGVFGWKYFSVYPDLIEIYGRIWALYMKWRDICTLESERFCAAGGTELRVFFLGEKFQDGQKVIGSAPGIILYSRSSGTTSQKWKISNKGLSVRTGAGDLLCRARGQPASFIKILQQENLVDPEVNLLQVIGPQKPFEFRQSYRRGEVNLWEQI